MTVYEKNIEAIKDMHEYLYSFIDKLTINNKNDIDIKSIDTKENYKALVVNINNKSYRLNSSVKPVEEAKRWADQFNYKNIEIIASIFGFGNGILPRELLGRLKDNELLVIYEPSREIFSYILENYDISDILEDRRVYIIIEDVNDNEFTRTLWHNVDWANMKSQIICTHPKYDEIFPRSYQLFKKLIVDNNERITLVKDSEGYLSKRINENTIMNTKFIKNSYTTESLKEVLTKDIPVFIVSSGPSLCKNIDELNRAKGKAIIISVDRATEYLVDKGIIPDLIIMVDPIKELTLFDNEVIKNIPLIFCSEANYMMINKHTGRKILLNGHEYFNALCKNIGEELPNISLGGSVSTAALAICDNIGFKRITLVGQDLAYTGGITYAGDTKTVHLNGVDEVFVEGIYGDPVITRIDWLYHLDWLNDAVDVISYKGNEVIDATEGGVKIKGTKIMVLKEVIDLYCVENINIDCLIDKMKLTFVEEDIKSHINQSLKELCIIKEKSSVSIDICKELIEGCVKIDENELFTSYTNKLIENNKIIGSFSVNHLLDTYLATIDTEQLTDVYVIDDNEETNKLKTYVTAIGMFKATLNGIEDIRRTMERLLKEL